MNKDHELDKVDKQILSILMKDATATYAEIAAKLDVSGGTIHVRMKKLEQLGVIKTMHLKADNQKLGFDLKAFVGITLSTGISYKDVIREFEKIPEVTNVDLMTGKYSLLIQIITKNNNHLKNILQNVILKVTGVADTETFISLEECIDRQIDIMKIENNKKF